MSRGARLVNETISSTGRYSHAVHSVHKTGLESEDKVPCVDLQVRTQKEGLIVPFR